MLRIYRLGSLVVLMSLVSIVSRAQEADDEAKSAEKVLAAKGLKKFGASLVALEETELNKTFRVIPKLKRSVRDAEKALAAVGKKAAANKKLITVYTQKRRQINAALAKGGLTFNQQNQAITLYNELGDRIRLLIENGGMEKQLKAARGERNKAREAYIGHVLNMRKLAEKIRKTYADATADEEAKVAVAKLNQATGKNFALKESTRFLANLRSLKRLEDSVLSERIDLRTDGSDTYYVSVVLNGKYTKELCLDSGSSLISLPYKMAREVGLNPDSSNEEIILVLADGRRVTAKLMKLSKVRVGKFELEDVECAVMPATLTEAAPILGMSFLRNFSFKIDSGENKLTMTKVETSRSRTKPRR